MRARTPRSIGCDDGGADRGPPSIRLPTDRAVTRRRPITPLSDHAVSDGRGRGRRLRMTERDDLPLPDYDHLPVGSLISRIRTLDLDALTTLLAYERAHANRVQVVTVMESRLAGLREGAQPSGGDPAAVGADAPAAAAGG